MQIIGNLAFHASEWVQQNGMGLLWAVVLFALLVFLHEFGHFIIAKKTGVKVFEFSLGFGHPLIRWKMGETEYAVRMFPLGGYVKMLGEGDDGDPNDPANFQNKTVGQKISVVAAGPLMNYFLAIVLFFVIQTGFSMHYACQIAQIVHGKPAEKAGLAEGDQIVMINGTRYVDYVDPTSVTQNVVNTIRGSAGKPLHMQIERDGKLLEVDVTPVPRENEKIGIIGIVPVTTPVFGDSGGLEKFDAVRSVSASFLSPWHFTKETFLWLAGVFQGKQKAKDLLEASAGPVGITHQIVRVYNQHREEHNALPYLLWLAAVLNTVIGLFNLFPIPALDGSRIFFIGLGAAFGKPLSPKLEEGIHFAGFAFLLALMGLVTYHDILRIFKGAG